MLTKSESTTVSVCLESTTKDCGIDMTKVKTFVQGLATITMYVLAFIGILVLWTSLDDEFSDSPTVIIEYECIEVQQYPDDFPNQVVEECSKLTTPKAKKTSKLVAI